MTDKDTLLIIYREAIIAMVEDGWLYCGEEGMSEAQEKCYNAYILCTSNIFTTDINDVSKR